MEAETLSNLAKQLNLHSLVSKTPEKLYLVRIYSTLSDIKILREQYKKPNVPDDYEEDATSDLNLFLIQYKTGEAALKPVASRIFHEELKSLTDKKRVIKAETTDRPIFIRKVGRLLDENDKAYLETCGDYRGMVIWNPTYLQDIQRIKV